MFLGRVVLPGESLWLDEDREKMRALWIDEAERCPTCGVHESEIADEKGYPLNPPHVIPETHRCYVCEEADRVRAAVPRDQDRGISVRLRSARFDEFDAGE